MSKKTLGRRSSDTGDNPPNPKWIFFPIFDDATKYETKKQGKVKGARKETIKAIDALKPYRGGNDTLWILYRLNNVEKHRLLLTVGAKLYSVDIGAHMSGLTRKAFANLDIPTMSMFLNADLVDDASFPLKVGGELFIGAPDEEVNKEMKFGFSVALHEPKESRPFLVGTLRGS